MQKRSFFREKLYLSRLETFQFLYILEHTSPQF